MTVGVEKVRVGASFEEGSEEAGGATAVGGAGWEVGKAVAVGEKFCEKDTVALLRVALGLVTIVAPLMSGASSLSGLRTKSRLESSALATLA